MAGAPSRFVTGGEVPRRRVVGVGRKPCYRVPNRPHAIPEERGGRGSLTKGSRRRGGGRKTVGDEVRGSGDVDNAERDKGLLGSAREGEGRARDSAAELPVALDGTDKVSKRRIGVDRGGGVSILQRG